MTIQEVAEKFSISSDTLRYYEKIGVIPQVHRTSGGIRDYKNGDLSWIQLVKCLRDAGLSLDAIKEYTRLFQIGDKTIPDRLKLLKTQKEILVEQKNKIEYAISKLDYKINHYEMACQNGKLVWDK